MRLEYLADGSPDCPLIRLLDFTPAEAKRLHAGIMDLAATRVTQLAVEDLDGVVAISGCQLLLRVHEWDQAVVRVGPLAFECRFTPGTWDNVAGLIEPFAAGGGGHQWLAGVPGEASLLLSVSGQW